ncbi:MAG: hypothetical protein H0U69_03490 [Trueperaceae bacterium]|nr:hypothetical protein [Trueperaceae bacterium]
MTTRTDPHSPKNFEPTHYTFIGWIYTGSNVEAADALNDPEAVDFMDAHPHVGVYGASQCDHCGSRFAYGAVFSYRGEGWITVGHDCASGRFNCPDRFTFELATMRRKVAALREYGKKSAAVRKLMAAHPDLAVAAEWSTEAWEIRNDLRAQDTEEGEREARVLGHLVGFNIDTIRDIVAKLFRYGSISEKQTAFVIRLAREGQEKLTQAKAIAERIAAMEPLTAGRQALEGTLKSVKSYDGFNGPVWKMVVALDSGHAVFGTVPGSLWEDANRIAFGEGTVPMDGLKGIRVRFDANVDPSVGDNDFAKYSRPTKCEVLDVTPMRAAQARAEASEIERRLAQVAELAANDADDAAWTEVAAKLATRRAEVAARVAIVTQRS